MNAHLNTHAEVGVEIQVHDHLDGDPGVDSLSTYNPAANVVYYSEH